VNREKILDKSDLSNDRIIEEVVNRVRGEDGLWFVSKHLIGMTRLNEKIHRPGQMWFQKQIAEPDAVLAYRDPRASGKTSSITISFPFWCWAQLPRPRSPIQGVNTRLAIVAPKKEIASYNFLDRIMRLYNESEAYRELFPYIRVRSFSLKNGLLLYRPTEVGDPTITPTGMESVSTSFHFDIGFIDDPIHEQNYFSQTEVRRCVEWMYLSRNLVRSEGGSLAFIGNFWRLGDVQDQLRPTSEYFKDVRVWERGLTACGGCVGGRSEGHQHEGEIFPIALLDKDGIAPGTDFIDAARSSMPNYIYMAQCENNPVDASTLHFDKKWLKTWTWHFTPGGEPAIRVNAHPERVAMARLAGNDRFIQGMNTPSNTGATELIPMHMLDLYILVDPAPSTEESATHSRFACALMGVEKAGPRKFLIEEYAKNAQPHIHMNYIIDTWARWYPKIRKIVVEAVGYQAAIGDTLVQLAAMRNINSLKASDIEMMTRLRSEGAQEDRIRYALSPIIESGNFYINPTHRIFISEFDKFGVKGAKHDLLDAISNGPRVWGTRRLGKPGGTAAVVDNARRRQQSTDVTGYG
jgi:hypothetical protein